jgi:sigma-E factor negative regulatory protein RseC
MEERGIVIAGEKGRARVRIERSEACEGCHGCLMSDTGKYMIAEAEDRIGVSVGDVVRIETESATALKASLLLFGFPLLMIFAGYAAGSGLASLMANVSGQGLGIAGAGVFFAGSFGVLALMRGRSSAGGEGKSAEDRSVIVEILGHKEAAV